MDICGQTSSRDYQLYAQPRRTAGTGDRLLLPPGMDAAGGGDTERGRSVRERLEATLAGLGELDYLRTRQELLVRGALLPGGDPGRPTGPAAGDAHLEDPYLSCEEKLLEENILLLRKQLNCLRRRDAGLISQLQELDRQISDLRLDTEISHDHMETDSRPSSGFYDLSDGVNGSLSNSSNSVFSECLSSSRSSTADELVGCADCEGLLVLGVPYEDQSCSGTVRRSLSAPYPSSTCSSSLDFPPPAPSSAPFGLLSPADPQSAQTSKYQCDLVARHGSDVYRYPSPLHAVAVQSPMFFQTLQGPPPPHAEDAPPEGSPPPRVAPPLSAAAPQVHQSASWPTPSSSSSQCLPSSQTPSAKRLEGYIFGLLQRRSQPVRPSKPRTSINTDPGKSVHRQASLCGTRPGLGQGTLRGSEPRVLAAATASFEGGSVERRREEQAYHSHGRTQNGYGAGNGDLAQNGCSVNSGTQQDGHPLSSSGLNGHTTNNYDVHMNNSSSMEKKGLSSGNKATASSSTGTLPSHYKDLGSPTANSSPKELKHSCYPSTTEPDPPVKSPRTVKPQSVTTPQKSPMKPLPPTPNGKGDGSPSELVSLGSSSQSQDEGHMVGDQHLPARGHAAAKPRKGSGNKSLKTSAKKNQPTRASRGGSDNNGPARSDRTAKPGGGSRRTPQCDETIIAPHHQKVSKRSTVAGGAPPRASRLKRIPPSIPEDQVVFLDRPMATSTLISNASSRCGASRPSHGQHRGHHVSSHHHQHHGRDPVVVVAKPKHKRNDYRHLRAMAEVPYDEAFRRAQRRQRKQLLLLGQSAAPYLTSGAPRYPASPYAYAGGGSDSEYSAECASLFHSTIADTSEDERRSNYTTNRFGDSESSGSDDDGELEGDDSASVSDSQESGAGGAVAGPPGGGGGGAGGSGARLGGTAGSGTRGAQDAMTPAQAKAFVKIKASRNLKKRILRFKSGSLKLMTTV